MTSPWIVKARTAAPAEFDRPAVVRAAEVLFDPSPASGVQVQGFKPPVCTTLAGRCGELAILAAVEAVAGQAGVYWSLNPVPPTLTEFAKNGDVLRRRWLLFDFDPVRPAGSNATTDEKDAAQDAAGRCLEWLASEGWPEPVVVDSGNGWHLLYRIDLGNDDAAKALVKACLFAAADLYDTETVMVDRAVFDARRVSKLPGTWARKGPHSEERPHRLAKRHHIPETVIPVSVELLTALAKRADKSKTPEPITPLPEPMHGPVWRIRAGHSDRDTAYKEAALRNEVLRVKMAKTGAGNPTANDAAFRLGTLCGNDVCFRQRCEAELRLAIFGWENETRTAGTIKRALDAGQEKPRPPRPELNGQHPKGSKADKGKEEPQEWEVQIDGEIVQEGDPAIWLKDASGHWATRKRSVVEYLTLPHILATDYADPRWIVPGIWSEGLNILAGKPKLGKSMFALNLGITIAGGGKALGDIQTAPGDVLYLALEDKARRIKQRASRMMAGLGVEASQRLKIATSWPRQNNRGQDLIADWADKHCIDRPVLLIVDVWAKFRTPQPTRGSAYDQDYDAMTQLKDLCDAKGFSCIAVMHCRKGKSEDVIEEVSGTMGLSGASDGIVALSRARNDTQAKIFITGRDVPDTELALEFNTETLTWRSLGLAGKHVDGKLQKSILDYLTRVAQPMHTRDIAAAIGADPESVRVTLWKLHAKQVVTKKGNAWGYPLEDAVPPADAEEF